MESNRIRVLEAIPPAWAHTRQVLFRPLDVGRWLTLGFLSFLQGLGEGGFNFPGIRLPEPRRPIDGEALREFWRWVAERLSVLLGVCGVALVLAVGLGLLLLWLSARGTFCYLDAVVTNRPEVRRPWREHRTIANSYFLVRLVLDLAALAAVLAVTVPFGLWVLSRRRMAEGLRADASWTPGRILSALFDMAGGEVPWRDPAVLIALVVWLVVLIGIVVTRGVLHILLVDFVAPVQYLTRTGAYEALRAVLGLAASHVGPFLLYLVVRVAIALAVGCGIALVGCMTCCAFFCLTVIPVVSQTVLQPVYAFFRAFPLFVLRQWGPAWDVFALPPSPTPPAEPSGGPVPA